MLFYRKKSFADKSPEDTKKLIFIAKKLLPDVVFNMANLEGNPYSYPEVHTLLDGITVGGHKLSDQEQILDIKKSWETLFTMIKKDRFKVCKGTFHKLNLEVAKNEALIAGDFRDGEVRIGGTDFVPPKAEELDSIFDKELKIIMGNQKATITEQALDVFLWGCLNQFYYDGNKRTSRLMANGILISNGQGILNIKAKDKLEFNTLMVDFYNTQKADKVCEFLYNKCLER